MLHLLIAQKVPNIDEEWETFKNHLREAIKKAAVVKVDKKRAQTFVDQLREFFASPKGEANNRIRRKKSHVTLYVCLSRSIARTFHYRF